jgi:hypothetical protein
VSVRACCERLRLYCVNLKKIRVPSLASIPERNYTLLSFFSPVILGPYGQSTTVFHQHRCTTCVGPTTSPYHPHNSLSLVSFAFKALYSPLPFLFLLLFSRDPSLHPPVRGCRQGGVVEFQAASSQGSSGEPPREQRRALGEE